MWCTYLWCRWVNSTVVAMKTHARFHGPAPPYLTSLFSFHGLARDQWSSSVIPNTHPLPSEGRLFSEESLVFLLGCPLCLGTAFPNQHKRMPPLCSSNSPSRCTFSKMLLVLWDWLGSELIWLYILFPFTLPSLPTLVDFLSWILDSKLFEAGPVSGHASVKYYAHW